MPHIPYGYKTENGEIMIDDSKAEQVRVIFSAYLTGVSLVSAASCAGLKMTHSSVKRILTNRKYLGEGYYPAIISEDVFNRAGAMIEDNAARLGRDKLPGKKHDYVIRTDYTVGKIAKAYDDPFRQAQYAYSQIQEE